MLPGLLFAIQEVFSVTQGGLNFLGRFLLSTLPLSLRVTWFVTSSDVIARMIDRAAIEKNPGMLALPNMGSGNEDFHKLKGALFLRRRLAKSNHFPIQSFIVSPNVMDAQ